MELKIEYLPVVELKAWENNAKVHTDEQIEQIKNSIREFGFNDPIAIWKDNEIIEGHGRLAAAKELGLEVVPVIRLDSLTDEQRRAYSIVHNKIAERSSWDNDLLGEELKVLMSEFDMTDLGFGEFELAMLTEDFEPVSYTDDETIKEYSEHENDYLAKRRVIITFTEEQESFVSRMLGLEEVKKVVYDASELMK